MSFLPAMECGARADALIETLATPRGDGAPSSTWVTGNEPPDHRRGFERTIFLRRGLGPRPPKRRPRRDDHLFRTRLGRIDPFDILGRCPDFRAAVQAVGRRERRCAFLLMLPSTDHHRESAGASSPKIRPVDRAIIPHACFLEAQDPETGQGL